MLLGNAIISFLWLVIPAPEMILAHLVFFCRAGTPVTTVNSAFPVAVHGIRKDDKPFAPFFPDFIDLGRSLINGFLAKNAEEIIQVVAQKKSDHLVFFHNVPAGFFVTGVGSKQ